MDGETDELGWQYSTDFVAWPKKKEGSLRLVQKSPRPLKTNISYVFEMSFSNGLFFEDIRSFFGGVLYFLMCQDESHS